MQKTVLVRIRKKSDPSQYKEFVDAWQISTDSLMQLNATPITGSPVKKGVTSMNTNHLRTWFPWATFPSLLMHIVVTLMILLLLLILAISNSILNMMYGFVSSS